MIDLIRKRHAGEGWMVFTELANGTGYKVSRHADAAALGIWPSRGYELHGYEIKTSRGDVQKELNDPSKADAVGKYCDFWWLVIDDLKIIDGLVIPKTWGVLVPKNQVLRIHRKAPKRSSTPVDRAFVAAMLRNVTNTWVPKWEHEAFKQRANETAKAELKRQHEWEHDHSATELERLKAKVKVFQDASGVDIDAIWNAGPIGEAVKLLDSIRYQTDAKNLEHRLQQLQQTSAMFRRVADDADHAARVLSDVAKGSP